MRNISLSSSVIFRYHLTVSAEIGCRTTPLSLLCGYGHSPIVSRSDIDIEGGGGENTQESVRSHVSAPYLLAKDARTTRSKNTNFNLVETDETEQHAPVRMTTVLGCGRCWRARWTLPAHGLERRTTCPPSSSTTSPTTTSRTSGPWGAFCTRCRRSATPSTQLGEAGERGGQ